MNHITRGSVNRALVWVAVLFSGLALYFQATEPFAGTWVGYARLRASFAFARLVPFHLVLPNATPCPGRPTLCLHRGAVGRGRLYDCWFGRSHQRGESLTILWCLNARPVV
jgi:hypothetical protein